MHDRVWLLRIFFSALHPLQGIPMTKAKKKIHLRLRRMHSRAPTTRAEQHTVEIVVSCKIIEIATEQAVQHQLGLQPRHSILLWVREKA
eukprot:m.277923 g.277923  ORF g.277923 m.277923 type:complete len:89 (-) comp22876_c3_seq23:391-657(-)